MSWLISVIVLMLVIAAGLLIISKIPAIGVEVDSMGIALTSAVVFGVLNGLLGWVGALFRATWILSPPFLGDEYRDFWLGGLAGSGIPLEKWDFECRFRRVFAVTDCFVYAAAGHA
jgi:hypothetical protein